MLRRVAGEGKGKWGIISGKIVAAVGTVIMFISVGVILGFLVRLFLSTSTHLSVHFKFVHLAHGLL